MAFHSHARSAISVLRYSGLENFVKDNVDLRTFFKKIDTFQLKRFVRTLNCRLNRVLGSWWTDDSSILIVQLSLNKIYDEDSDQNESDEEQLPQAYDIVNHDADFFANELPSTPSEREASPPSSSQFSNSAAPNLPETKQPPTTTDQYSETSRTIPFYLAMESAATISLDGERVAGETSRTMPVYHSLTASIIDGERDGWEVDPSIPSTSNWCPPREEEEPREKRQKIGEDSSFSDFDSLFDQLTENLSHNKSQENRSPAMRSLIENLRNNPRISSRQGSPITNASGLGYSAPGSILRRSRASAIPVLPNFHDDSADEEEEENSERSDTVMGFLAFDVKTSTTTPLILRNLNNNFKCHMRNRRLTVCCNENLIETYQLTKSNGKNEWEKIGQTRLPNLNSFPIDLHYRCGTAVGMSSRMEEVEQGQIFTDVFNFHRFHSPIQQDILTILHRDAPEHASRLFGKSPKLTQCHMISDDLLAVTMTFHKRRSSPLHIGATISILDSSITVYPNYHEYLKLLFTHHLPDLLPRHWTYLNPTPAHEQPWFKNSLINVSNPDELNNFDRLFEVYHILISNFNNVKSTSNPLTDAFFNAAEAEDFMNMGKSTNHYPRDTSAWNHFHENEEFGATLYYHPIDPVLFLKVGSFWLVAHRQADVSDDFIVSKNLEH